MICLFVIDMFLIYSSFSGWGKIKHPGSSHPILQQAKMPPVAKDVCVKKLAASPGTMHFMKQQAFITAALRNGIDVYRK